LRLEGETVGRRVPAENHELLAVGGHRRVGARRWPGAVGLELRPRLAGEVERPELVEQSVRPRRSASSPAAVERTTASRVSRHRTARARARSLRRHLTPGSTRNVEDPGLCVELRRKYLAADRHRDVATEDHEASAGGVEGAADVTARSGERTTGMCAA